MKKLLSGMLAVALCASAGAGNPRTSFAVIIDEATYGHCREAVEDYIRAVEEDGLPVVTEAAEWKSPEEVKAALVRLRSSDNIEGAVLIGDVPIPMVMKAQYMTSAYKMDERKYPLETVAVPSDRFYDDFDLSFRPLDADPQGLMHFYELTEDSLPYIDCDIYTGRIMAQESLGDKYAQISAYLRKAASAHRADNPLDQLVSYTGHGSYSNSLTAWRAEHKIVDEQFGDRFRHNNARFLRYSMEDYMKPYLIKEMRRKDLDIMAFHEHGDYFRMYLSGYPEDRDAEEYIGMTLRGMARRDSARAYSRAAEMGLDSSWVRGFDKPGTVALDSLADLKTGIILEEIDVIAPNAKFVIFDACYNGDFRNPDFVAGKFIMSGGECVTCFANSVNVLQDKSAFDLMGLLGSGARIGLWARHINILESHIIGDPTFRFTSDGAAGFNAMLADDDASFWSGRLDNPDPEMQNMAMIKLFRAGWPGMSGILADKFASSPYAIVRWCALTMLERYADANFREALKLGSTDSFEFIRRISVNRMGKCGDAEFLPYLVASYVEDHNAERVLFNVNEALLCFDKDKAQAAVDDYFARHSYYNAASDREALTKLIATDQAAEALGSISSTDEGLGWKVSRVNFLRNRPYHQITADLLDLMCDPAQDEFLRTMLAESLAWYRLAYNKGEIVSACESLLSSPGCPDAMRPALRNAVVRLSSKR